MDTEDQESLITKQIHKTCESAEKAINSEQNVTRYLETGNNLAIHNAGKSIEPSPPISVALVMKSVQRCGYNLDPEVLKAQSVIGRYIVEEIIESFGVANLVDCAESIRNSTAQCDKLLAEKGDAKFREKILELKEKAVEQRITVSAMLMRATTLFGDKIRGQQTLPVAAFGKRESMQQQVNVNVNVKEEKGKNNVNGDSVDAGPERGSDKTSSR